MSINEISQTEKETVRGSFAEIVRSEHVTMPESEVARIDGRHAKPPGYADQGHRES